MRIELRSNEELQQREVVCKGEVLKAFSYYDDYAYTKARDYQKEINILTKEEFKDRFPELFL